MKPTQALDMIKQVVEAYRGSLNEHQSLQQAMQVITKELNAKEETNTKETEVKKVQKT